jgi:hypothetical protein
MKNHDQIHQQQDDAPAEGVTKFMSLGTMTYTPATLTTGLQSDAIRFGVPIMRPGFITQTELAPPTCVVNWCV